MKYKSVDEYMISAKYWKDSLIRLREILCSTELEETLKWGMPTYTYQNKNVVGIGAFKSYFGLWFFQGSLLPDKDNVLINAQEGKTAALRQWRFTSHDEINDDLIKTYVFEAIKNQADGKEIKPDLKKPLVIPSALNQLLNNDPLLKASFEKLTLSKRREYAGYISEAKRENTKQSRLIKITPLILEGKGLHDKYKKS